MARIAIGGFQHETNTFAPLKASFEDFAEGGGWPPLQRGSAMLPEIGEANLPIVGAAQALQGKGHALVPLVWAAATPSAEVMREAYERIAGMLLDDLAAQGPFDGVYLDLHGAMVAEHLEDGEGELLRRVRAVVGPEVPVVASLDLHANVTPEMVGHADALVAYRTYPHIDMAATGARAALLLDRLLAGAGPRHKAFRQLPYIIPLTWQCTLVEPGARLYAALERIESNGEGLSLSFTPGFPAADIHHCGPAVFAYGQSQTAAERAADALYAEVVAAEKYFVGRLYVPDEGVRAALEIAGRATKPVILTDTQDNPGAGGTSDTTGLLAALVAHDAPSVLGVMADPEAAEAAHRAGVGATIAIALGGKSGAPGQAPFRGSFAVERLGDGAFTGTGPMWRGVKVRLGPMALLRIGNVRVVVAAKRLQAADQSIFRHLGIEPAREKILGLKSSVHYRADFQPIAAEILVVAAPGALVADPAKLPFTRLRPGVRLCPLGPVFAPR
jgi:microcystin degradation protein MlrC